MWLLSQVTYRVALDGMEESNLLGGNEQSVLNTIWLTLLGLEAILVVGFAVHTVSSRLSPGPKQKTQ